MKYRNNELNTEIKHWIDVNLKNFIEENPLSETEIEHIVDYLLSDKAPARLKKMSVPEALNNAEKWTRSLQKRGNNIMETEEDYKVIKQFEGGLKLVRLKSKSSYDREGNLMRHCVASYYGRKDTQIYSLRDSQNQPHTTIEVQHEGNYIQQIKGKGNGSIHPRYIKAVIESLKILGMNIRESEMSNLGYIDLENLKKGFTKYIKEKEPKSKWLTFKGKEYLYEPSIK